MSILIVPYNITQIGDLRDRNHTVVGFTTTYAISAYHHYSCEFKSRSCRGINTNNINKT
jgi:hypothetical protein